MSRVYFVDSGLGGCYLVRCLLPLQENGWDGDRTSLLPEGNTPEDKAKAALASDVVVFHRPEQRSKLDLMRILKQGGKKIVFDNDDTVKHDGGFRFNDYMDRERVARGLATINENIDAFLQEADLVTCSTEFLAEEYRKLNPNVVMLPNCIDPFMFDEPLRNEGDKVRIGITGSVGITSDLDVLEPILKHYEHDPRVQLVVFSLPPNKQDEYMRKLYQKEYEFWDALEGVEWQPFAPVDTYLKVLNELRLDIMLIPRADNYFNRCKSNIKFLEASMLEIPVIAQAFEDGLSPYQVNEEDQNHLLLATDFDNWIAQIESLIEDKDKRRSMAKQAHTYVEETYDIAKHAHQWEDAYKTLYEK